MEPSATRHASTLGAHLISRSHKEIVMTNLHSQNTQPSPLARAWKINPGLTALVVFSLVLIVSSILGLLIDQRSTAMLGTPTWIKTFKFSVSTALYGATLLWAITLTQGRARLIAGRAATVLGWVLVLELLLLVIQGARAQPMHFNESGLVNLILWRTMTVGIIIMFISFIVLMVNVIRGINTNPVLAWSLRLGLIVTAIGLAQGFAMTGPTPAQLEVLQAGKTVSLMGAHTVGSSSITPDNGPGLPLVGWSTTHGDLRIGHFIGLHALQIIPLLGLWLSRRREHWLGMGHRLGLVWIAALGFTSLIVLVTWQALRGQSIIAPDATTLTAFATMIGTMLISSITVLAHARARNTA